jgi:hypothetical protein
MGLEMRQELRASIRQELKSELKQELRAKLAQVILLLQEAILDDPSDTLKEIIARLLQEMPEGQLKEGLSALLEDNILQELLINRSSMIVGGGTKYAHEFATDYIHKKMDGRFKLQSFDDNSKPESTDTVQVDLGAFKTASENPERIERELSDLTYLVKNSKESSVAQTKGSIDQMRRLRNALDAAGASQDSIKTIEEVMIFALARKDPDGRSIKEFLKDYAIMRNISDFISERIINRFAARCQKMNSRSTPEQFESAFLNSIGEYVLACMGVVDPDLFSLQKCDLELDDYLELKDRMQKLGVNLDKKMADSNFKQSGTIFFNRWKVIGQKPGIVSDDNVRDFITKTVRASSVEILALTKYDDRFKEIIEIINGRYQGVSKEEIDDQLRGLFIDILGDENFQKKVVLEGRTRWSDALAVFSAS